MIWARHATKMQLSAAAVHAIGLVRWEPRPDLPGNIWTAETELGFLEVVRIPGRDAARSQWVGRINGVDTVQGDTPRVTMDLLGRQLVETSDNVIFS